MKCPKEGCDYESSEKGVKCHHAHAHNESIAGVECTCANCGNSTRKRRNVVERFDKHFCSDKCRDNHRSGKGNPNWSEETKTKFSSSTSGQMWRKAVFQRDDFTCQDCGDDTGGNLQAHHIKRRKDCEERNGIDEKYAIWNGVTLCLDCHAERHKEEDVYQMMKKQAQEVEG